MRVEQGGHGIDRSSLKTLRAAQPLARRAALDPGGDRGGVARQPRRAGGRGGAGRGGWGRGGRGGWVAAQPATGTASTGTSAVVPASSSSSRGACHRG